MSGDRLQLVAWKPLRKGSLVGLACVRLPIGLVIRDRPVHLSHGKAWAPLPAKPQVDKGGQLIRDARGKTAYVAILEFDTKKLRDALSERVVEAVRAQHPDAFDNTEQGGSP
jgi:hypothetical protein